jgi:AraC-like DNA-binding protein
MSVSVRVEERADWTHAVANAQQRFIGRTLTADPYDFERAVRLFCREIPPPPSLHDRERLRTDLFACACRAGLHLHALYHRTVPSRHCARSPIEDIGDHWRDHEIDPRLLFRRWAVSFVTTFQSAHALPAAVEASAVLRRQFRSAVTVNELARDVGASRSKLIREFRRYFDTTIGEYQLILRLRWALRRVRDPRRDSNRVAIQAGFRSARELENHLRRRTGLGLWQLQVLTEERARTILNSALAAPWALSMHRRR